MKSNLVWSTIKKVMKKNSAVMSLLFVIIVAVVGLSLLPPQLLKYIIDHNLVPKDWSHLKLRAVIYLLLVVLTCLCEFVKNGLLTIFGQKIMSALRLELNEKLMRLPSSYYSSHSTGEITSRVMNDVSSAESLFSDGIISMMIDCLKILGIIVSIFLFSTTLGIIVLFLIPIIYAITRAFQRRMLQAQIDNLEQYGAVNGHIAETLRSVKMIKSYSKERYMEQLYEHRIEENFKTIGRVNFLDSVYSPIILVLRAVLISVIVFLASDQIQAVGLTIGMVAASIEFISNLFSPIEALGMELQSIQKGISGVKRLNTFYCEPEEKPKGDIKTAETILSLVSKDCLRFENVSFAYEEGQSIFEHLNANIQAGTTVTFMGRTGIGKTTLFRLIMGLLTPTSGEILLGETKVCDIPNAEKRKIFGYVEQQFQMIDGTIADQISLKDETITKDMILRALQFVGLSDYVETMEQGIDTMISPATTFSQGQKQLLSIARAIVANPPILLLDEITASLDSATEAHIVQVLQKAKEGRTVLSISHRKTAILKCDQMIMLENLKG